MIRLLLLLILLILPGSRLHAENPFGLMLWPAPGQDVALMAARAASLGVVWYRPPNLYTDRWRDGAPCPACRALAHSGLKLAITIRNGGRDTPPRHPAAPPLDLKTYGRIVAAMLDQWQPDLVAVEDEEDRPQRYDWQSGSDTARAYGRSLDVACAAAHARHALCSNGGLSFAAVTALTWVTLRREGKPDLACDYARRALPNLPELCQSSDDGLQNDILDHVEQLLPIYRSSPIDAVNFHWFGSDAVALAVTIDVLGRLTGKNVMSNQIGLPGRDGDPSHVRPLMRASMAGHLLAAIWFSNDGADSQSLFDSAGRLRPAGEEFAHQMSGRK